MLDVGLWHPVFSVGIMAAVFCWNYGWLAGIMGFKVSMLLHPKKLTAGTWKWWFPIGISEIPRGPHFQVPCFFWGVYVYKLEITHLLEIEHSWLKKKIHHLSLRRFKTRGGGLSSRGSGPLFIFQPLKATSKKKKDTPPKTNMEPENGPLEKEIPIGNHHFQVPC